MPAFSLDGAPRRVLPPLRSTIDAPLPLVLAYEPIASAQDLSPVTLSAQDHSTSELLRTLSRVAASKPTSWLSGRIHILTTLSLRFGTLAGGLGSFPLDDGSSHSPSHSQVSRNGIRSLVEVGRSTLPLVHPVALPPSRSSPEAAPQCISGRTSYHRTRLAFHSYPQLIQDFCNSPWFGPPSGFTRTSTWPWIDRTASGL